MADGVNLNIEGLQDLKKLMQNYPTALNAKILKSAQRRAVKPLITEAKDKTTSKFIADNLRIKSVRSKGNEVAAIEAGFIYKKSTNKDKRTPWYARFVEFGTKVRKPRKGKFLTFKNKQGDQVFVKEAKGINAKPFWRPAKDKHWQDGAAPTRVIRYELAKALESFQRRYIKKYS